MRRLLSLLLRRRPPAAPVSAVETQEAVDVSQEPVDVQQEEAPPEVVQQAAEPQLETPVEARGPDLLLQRLVAYYGRALAKGKRARRWWERGGDVVAVNVNTPLAYIPRPIEDGVMPVVALWAVAKEFGYTALACVYSWDGCLEDVVRRMGGLFAARWTTWPLPPTGHVALVTLDFREDVLPLGEFNFGVLKDAAYVAAAARGEKSWCAAVFINPSYVVHI